jgi:lysozyme
MSTLRSKAIEIAAALCRYFEGFVGTPYLCAAGVPTIGYGATHYADGRRVKLTDQPISREAGERLLIIHIERTYLPDVLRLCPVLINESAERLAAIIDFTFNLGSGNLSASTLRRRINSGDWADVPTQLMRWNKAGGRVLRGLTRRRQAEANLI